MFSREREQKEERVGKVAAVAGERDQPKSYHHKGEMQMKGEQSVGSEIPLLVSLQVNPSLI